jgi:hypothetical protein
VIGNRTKEIDEPSAQLMHGLREPESSTDQSIEKTINLNLPIRDAS